MKAIHHQITGLKCDVPGCAGRDDSIKFEEYSNHIGHPCPVCGASMLTKEDHELVLALIKMAEDINETIGEVPDNTPTIAVKMNMNGTGTVDPEIV